MLVVVFIFFFRHRTAYVMRISDWSSDGCSSELLTRGVRERLPFGVAQVRHGFHPCPTLGAHVLGQRIQLAAHQFFQQRGIDQKGAAVVVGRSAERRVGKEWASEFRSRGSQYTQTK